MQRKFCRTGNNKLKQRHLSVDPEEIKLTISVCKADKIVAFLKEEMNYNPFSQPKQDDMENQPHQLTVDVGITINVPTSSTSQRALAISAVQQKTRFACACARGRLIRR